MMTMTHSDINPQPRAWPCCSECKTAYVLRRTLMFGTKGKRMTLANEWVWQRDCKHRKAKAGAAGIKATKGRP